MKQIFTSRVTTSAPACRIGELPGHGHAARQLWPAKPGLELAGASDLGGCQGVRPRPLERRSACDVLTEVENPNRSGTKS